MQGYRSLHYAYGNLLTVKRDMCPGTAIHHFHIACHNVQGPCKIAATSVGCDVALSESVVAWRWEKFFDVIAVVQGMSLSLIHI